MSRALSSSTVVLLLLPPLFWAGNAVVGRALVGHFPPLALSFARWALALALLAPFVLGAVREHRGAIRANLPVLALTAFLGVGCYNSLQYLALQTSTAVNATLIGASGPIMTLLVGAAWFNSPVRRRQGAGAALSVMGVLWVIARGEPLNLLRLQFAAGDVIMLVATFAWSIYTWLLRTRRPPLPLSVFLFVQIALGAAMILPFALVEYVLSGATRGAHRQQRSRPALRRAAAVAGRVLLLGSRRRPRGRRAADVLRQPHTGARRAALVAAARRSGRLVSPGRRRVDTCRHPPGRAAGVDLKRRGAGYNPAQPRRTRRALLPGPDAVPRTSSPMSMRNDQVVIVRRSEYQPPAFLVDEVTLEFDLDSELTQVTATLAVRRNPDGVTSDRLLLDGEDLELLSLELDGRALGAGDFELHDGGLALPGTVGALHGEDRQSDPTGGRTRN